MHLASWSLAALVTVAALLLTHSTEAASKVEKSTESHASSLEDELESSLSQPQPQPQPQPEPEEQLNAAMAIPRPSEQHHVTRQQQQRQRQGPTHRPSRQEMREMFRELLDSMTDAERKSLTLRLGRDSVKRTFSRMRDEVRAQPVAAPATVSKRASPLATAARASSRAKALRMRRSLLLGSMESGMSAARQRRRKRDLVDYSPEEYAQLAALLAGRPDYVEDADGDIRPEGDDGDGDGDDYGDDGHSEGGDSAERKLRIEGTGAVGPEERGRGDHDDDDAAAAADDDDDDDNNGHADVDDLSGGGLGDYNDERGELGRQMADEPLPPPPPPPPPPMMEPEAAGEPRHPLTMFMVRMAGEKGLFVPLDQDRAERLAVELAGEAAIAEAAQAQAAVEEAAAEAAEAVVERSRREAGVAELKRFAEKLARRVPPGY